MGHVRVGELKGKLPAGLEERAVRALEGLLAPDLKLDGESWDRMAQSAATLRSALADVDRGRADPRTVEEIERCVQELEKRPRALEPSASARPGFAPDWQQIPSHVNEPVLELLDGFGEGAPRSSDTGREKLAKRILRRKR